MDDNETKNFHPYVKDARPGGSSPIDMRAGGRFIHIGDVELTELEENVNWLTLDI